MVAATFNTLTSYGGENWWRKCMFCYFDERIVLNFIFNTNSNNVFSFSFHTFKSLFVPLEVSTYY